VSTYSGDRQHDSILEYVERTTEEVLDQQVEVTSDTEMVTTRWLHFIILPSVLWHCQLDTRKGIQPVKNTVS